MGCRLEANWHWLSQLPSTSVSLPQQFSHLPPLTPCQTISCLSLLIRCLSANSQSRWSPPKTSLNPPLQSPAFCSTQWSTSPAPNSNLQLYHLLSLALLNGSPSLLKGGIPGLPLYLSLSLSAPSICTLFLFSFIPFITLFPSLLPCSIFSLLYSLSYSLFNYPVPFLHPYSLHPYLLCALYMLWWK